MKKIKELMRKLAGWFVTLYCNRLYKKAVADADARHAAGEGTIYVVDHFLDGQYLTTIDRKQFRWIKTKAGELTGDKAYYSYDYGTPMLRRQCWYHTPDRSEKNGLSPREKEVRRLAFIRYGLKRARLLPKGE